MTISAIVMPLAPRPRGAVILALYGIVPTQQPAHFGRSMPRPEVSWSVAARPA